MNAEPRPDGRSNPRVNSDDPLVMSASCQPFISDRLEEAREGAEDHDQRDARERQQRERRVERHHAVPPLVTPVRAGDHVEHAADRTEDDDA